VSRSSGRSICVGKSGDVIGVGTSGQRKSPATCCTSPGSQSWRSLVAHARPRFAGSKGLWRSHHGSRSPGRPPFALRPIQERIAGLSLSQDKHFTGADFSGQRGWRVMGKARSPLAGEMCDTKSYTKSYCIFSCIVCPKPTQTTPNVGHHGIRNSFETSHGHGIRHI
jgi:hypothetical protein